MNECEHGLPLGGICRMCENKEDVSDSDSASSYYPFKPPFNYDYEGLCIVDIAGNMIVDIRGWGFLTGKGAMAYDSDKAAAIQDGIGWRIARIMNKDADT
jgi:hypothetical protein